MALDGFRKVVCPFCAQEFRLGDFGIYSQTTGDVIKQAPKNLWDSWTARVLPTRLEGKENVLARNLRQCPNPNCNKLLPLNIEYVDDNINIAIIGDSFSGKSHFIAAAIKQLKERRIPPQLGLAGFVASSSEVEAKYRNDYYEPLFGRNEALLYTPPAKQVLDEPLIYEMRIAGRRVNLFMYDASGEDLAQIDTRVVNRPHILNAQGMIFLADPWSMPGFVSQLAYHLRPDPKYFTGRSASDVLSNVIEVFKRASGQARETQFSLPVGIALSKSDLIPYVVTRSNDSRYQALSDSQYPGLLSREECNGIHAVVRQLLLEVGEQALVSMEQTIERINFSAVTATGTSSDGQGKYLDQVMPHRCLDPLFWILRELGIVAS